MLAWALSFSLAGAGLWSFSRGLGLAEVLFGISGSRAELTRIGAELREIEEGLSSGILPPEERWKALSSLPAPWGALISESVGELRSAGGALIPTLKRLRLLAEEHRAALFRARAKASQSLAQAVTCLLLVPLFGATLYAILPGMGAHPWRWLLACAGAFATAALGAVWMLRMAASARWGGLEGPERKSVLAAYCGGERFLALIRAGQPADLAWSKALLLLEREAPWLAADWGHSLWASGGAPGALGARVAPGSPRALLASAGEALRKAVQVSLIDGRPCGDRIEAALSGMRKDWDSLVERELCLLPTRTLKPLFLFVAPALLGLLVFGVAQIVWEWAGSSGGGLLGI